MIELEGILKRRGGRTVLDRVGFKAGAGRVTGFLGQNGAGKSSTLRILLGLDRPQEGKALIGGLPYQRLQRPLLTVGALLDGSGAHPARSGRGHLRWLATSNGLPWKRVERVLELVELQEAAGRRVGGYSLGMGRRLGMAAALLGDPQVLVLDEPTNGLDPAGIRWVRGLLRQWAAEGRTVLLSSHLMSEVADTVDDVVVIHQGRIMAEGSLSQVVGDHRDLEEAFFALTDPAAVHRPVAGQGWARP